MASKLTESARGKVCQLRLEGCIPGTDTTVFAHLNGGGMGLKNKVGDFHFGFYACMNCHDLYDGRKQANPPYDKSHLRNEGNEALIRTQRILVREGRIYFK